MSDLTDHLQQWHAACKAQETAALNKQPGGCHLCRYAQFCEAVYGAQPGDVEEPSQWDLDGVEFIEGLE
jgi:hypothetical protein